jgi:hypothetical protein
MPRIAGRVSTQPDASRVLAPLYERAPRWCRVAKRPLLSHPAILAAVAAGLVTLSTAGCSPDEETTESGCASTVHDASLAVDVADQLRLLDMAMVRCRSLQELTGEMGKYPGIVGYDLTTFVELRCTRVVDDSVRTSPSCLSLTATTAVPTTAPVELVFVGETLDGRRIEIRPDADTVFVGEVPQVVQQTVDIAIEAGCDGVIDQRDLWVSRVDDPVFGDEASVYAHHAQNVANYIGCVSPPLPTAAPG